MLLLFLFKSLFLFSLFYIYFNFVLLHICRERTFSWKEYHENILNDLARSKNQVMVEKHHIQRQGIKILIFFLYSLSL